MSDHPRTKVVPHLDRRFARVLAVQALYQQQTTSDTPAAILDSFLHHQFTAFAAAEGIPLNAIDRNLFTRLFQLSTTHRDDLQSMLAGYLSDSWKIARLDKVLLQICVLGLCELYLMPETPLKVIVNEYVEVTKAFYEGGEAGFVNQVLDNAGKALRVNEQVS